MWGIQRRVRTGTTTKALLVASSVVLSVLGAPSRGAAQDAEAVVEPGSPEHEAELGRIQTQVDWAAALYTEGIISTILGLGGGGFGVICCGVLGAVTFGLPAAVVTLIGLVSVGVAIGLDADSGPRRERLRARTRRALQLDLGPGRGARWEASAVSVFDVPF